MPNARRARRFCDSARRPRACAVYFLAQPTRTDDELVRLGATDVGQGAQLDLCFTSAVIVYDPARSSIRKCWPARTWTRATTSSDAVGYPGLRTVTVPASKCGCGTPRLTISPARNPRPAGTVCVPDPQAARSAMAGRLSSTVTDKRVSRSRWIPGIVGQKRTLDSRLRSRTFRHRRVTALSWARRSSSSCSRSFEDPPAPIAINGVSVSYDEGSAGMASRRLRLAVRLSVVRRLGVRAPSLSGRR
jgi:hypothetical protein